MCYLFSTAAHSDHREAVKVQMEFFMLSSVPLVKLIQISLLSWKKQKVNKKIQDNVTINMFYHSSLSSLPSPLFLSSLLSFSPFPTLSLPPPCLCLSTSLSLLPRFSFSPSFSPLPSLFLPPPSLFLYLPSLPPLSPHLCLIFPPSLPLPPFLSCVSLYLDPLRPPTLSSLLISPSLHWPPLLSLLDNLFNNGELLCRVIYFFPGTECKSWQVDTCSQKEELLRLRWGRLSPPVIQPVWFWLLRCEQFSTDPSLRIKPVPQPPLRDRDNSNMTSHLSERDREVTGTSQRS